LARMLLDVARDGVQVASATVRAKAAPAVEGAPRRGHRRIHIVRRCLRDVRERLCGAGVHRSETLFRTGFAPLTVDEEAEAAAVRVQPSIGGRRALGRWAVLERLEYLRYPQRRAPTRSDVCDRPSSG